MDPIAPLHTRQKLKMLGFLENEILIITILFKHKKLTATQLSQLTSLSYDIIQYSINNLEKKGLIRRASSNGDDIIEICSDAEFLEWIDKQKEKNADIYDDAKNAINTFFAGIQEQSWKPDVMYFEGKEGIISIYEDILTTGEDTFGWHDIEGIHQCIGDYVFEFIDRRSTQGITTQAILPNTPFNTERKQEHERRKVRFSDHLPLKGEIRIYGDKVAVITFDKEKPVGFVFSGKLVTSVFKAIFEHAWENGSK